MATPLLVLAIVAMAVVVFWYVLDEATRGGEGKSGILGMDGQAADSRPRAKSAWKRGAANRPWRVRRH